MVRIPNFLIECRSTHALNLFRSSLHTTARREVSVSFQEAGQEAAMVEHFLPMFITIWMTITSSSSGRGIARVMYHIESNTGCDEGLDSPVAI